MVNTANLRSNKCSAKIKTYLIIIFAIAYIITFIAIVRFSFFPHAADEQPGSDAVVVKVLDTPLPHEEKKRPEFLWSIFANKPEEQKFHSYNDDNWKDNFEVFTKVLVQKADAQKLNSASLRKVLDLVLKHSENKIAYLPIGAYQTTLDGKPIWVVVVTWEYPSEDGRGTKLGHIRMFAFDRKTLELVAFNTCM